MTPEHIEYLADLADPDKLWQHSPFDKLTPEQARQLETGVALRRHAAHVRSLETICGKGLSLLITPTRPNVVHTSVIPTPGRSEPRETDSL